MSAKNIYCTDSPITFAGSGSGIASYHLIRLWRIVISRFCMEVPYLSPEMVRSTPVWPILSRWFIATIGLLCKQIKRLRKIHYPSITDYVRPQFVDQIRMQVATYKRFKKLVDRWIELAILHSKFIMDIAKKKGAK
ncbi:MAG: hypothetical protein K8S24_11670 [Candidatus Aegiribacteria sp.]|nr:hypothetical protein [Candidatus Aegiribacteria sp.]